MKNYLLDDTSFILQFNRIPCNNESDIFIIQTIFKLILRRYLNYVPKGLENSDYKWIIRMKQKELFLFKALLV